MHPDPSLVEGLDRRIEACVSLPFQIVGEGHRRLTDPLRGGEVLLNPRRAERPRGGDRGCPFCTGQTPPTLFSITAEPSDVFTEGDRDEPAVGRPRVETETASLKAARGYVEGLPPGEPPDPWQAVRRMMDVRHHDWRGRDVAIGLPDHPWLVRTFLNFVPIIADRRTGANCFVLSVPPPFHDRDIGVLKHNPAGHQPPLPISVMEGLVESWIVLEAWAHHRGLIPVPFINGGKNPLSGQSLECFHSQFFAVGPDDFPPAFDRLRRLRGTNGCPVCDVIGIDDLVVARFGDFVVSVHPAPARNSTFVVAPVPEAVDLADLRDRRSFAAALSWAIRGYEVLLGGVPAYVVALRTGEAVGHLHAEVVPRSLVNVPGGFEETTGFAVTTKDPLEIAELLRAEHLPPEDYDAHTVGRGSDDAGSKR